MLTSVAAVALPNWRDLELAVGLVLISIGIIALHLESLRHHWITCITIPGVFGHITDLVDHTRVATLADRSGTDSNIGTFIKPEPRANCPRRRRC